MLLIAISLFINKKKNNIILKLKIKLKNIFLIITNKLLMIIVQPLNKLFEI